MVQLLPEALHLLSGFESKAEQLNFDPCVFMPVKLYSALTGSSGSVTFVPMFYSKLISLPYFTFPKFNKKRV